MGGTPSIPRTYEEQMDVLRSHETKCNHTIESYYQTHGAKGMSGFCPPIWDGIMCWDSSKSGRMYTTHCPSYFAGFHPQMLVSKECLQNGSWFKLDDESESWTNFSLCYNDSLTSVVVTLPPQADETFFFPYIPTLTVIRDVGYSLSLISLLVAFIIIISSKKLRCPRNVLHLHLFASFIMRAFMSLLKESLFFGNIATSQDIFINEEGQYFINEYKTNWFCRLITIFWQYFIMANYTWILMEGLYLHNLIFLALFTDSSSITLYIVLGWGLPVVFVVPWSLCRALLDNHFCWTLNNNTLIFLLIRVPLTATVLVNFVLFIKIVLVLYRKLQSSVCDETKTYSRWAKSTLVLLPLFGVHYTVFLGIQYIKNNTTEIIWLFGEILFSSFNGFFVALLYCFLNGEVRNELGKKWEQFSFRELLENCHILGDNGICSSLQFLGYGRHRQPRGSCYSSTAGTIDTVVTSCNRDKKRPQAAQTIPAQAIHIPLDEKKNLSQVKDDSDEGIDASQLKNGLSTFGKDRRWSPSDCDLKNNALELKVMTSPNSVVDLYVDVGGNLMQDKEIFQGLVAH